MPILILQFKNKTIEKYVMECGETMTIGRKDSNNIVIDNLAVSGNHARIDSVSATFILTDLQSTNGTFVNEKLISTHHLRNQDEIIIGKHKLIFDATDLERKLDEDLASDRPEKSSEGEYDKTRYLDTNEYRDLIQKAKDELIKK